MLRTKHPVFVSNLVRSWPVALFQQFIHLSYALQCKAKTYLVRSTLMAVIRRFINTIYQRGDGEIANNPSYVFYTTLLVR